MVTINQRVSKGKWGWHGDIRLPHPHFLIYSWSDAQKRLWTSENEGLGPMGWLSITARKSWVMSQRLNSSFISPHARVSSSLSVLIVSIPKSVWCSWMFFTATIQVNYIQHWNSLNYTEANLLSPLIQWLVCLSYQHTPPPSITSSFFIAVTGRWGFSSHPNLNKIRERITFLYSPNTTMKSEEDTLISPRRYHRAMSFSY